MARRQQLLGQLEEPARGRRRPPQTPPDSQSTRYSPEVKAKAYAAFLDGAGWSDCARAIGHPEPNGSGIALIQRWAEDDHWTRPLSAGDYKAKVEKERDADPQRISDEVDALCVKMQKVSENYIEQFFVEDEDTGEKHISINSAFKTRDFADMAAALRMIHETRIKIRKANEPKDKDGGKKNDFLTMIREAGQNRLRENRRRAGVVVPKSVQEEETDDDRNEAPAPDSPGDRSAEPVVLPSLAEIRARFESELGASRAETESLETDSDPDRE